MGQRPGTRASLPPRAAEPVSGQHSNGHVGEGVSLDPTTYVHESALLYGKVNIGAGSSVWPHVVMRSETFEIRIGERSNIQDFVMVHVGISTPTIVGDDCSITHHSTIHGCTIGDRCLVGINATVMDGAVIGDNSIVAGHSIVTENSEFPPNSIIVGVPAKVVATRDNGSANLKNAAFYHQNAINYAAGVERMSAEQMAALFDS